MHLDFGTPERIRNVFLFWLIIKTIYFFKIKLNTIFKSGNKTLVQIGQKLKTSQLLADGVQYMESKGVDFVFMWKVIIINYV